MDIAGRRDLTLSYSRPKENDVEANARCDAKTANEEYEAVAKCDEKTAQDENAWKGRVESDH